MACIPIHFNTILKSKDQTNHDKLLIIIINYYKLIYYNLFSSRKFLICFTVYMFELSRWNRNFFFYLIYLQQ